MKRSLFTISVVLLAVASAFAQKKNVSQAKSMLYATPVDYDKAIELIEQAKVDPTTANEASTWYVAGRIGYSMVYEDSPKYLAKMLTSLDRFYQGLVLMHDNYIKADALDGQPDKKGNPKYTQRKNIRNDFKEQLSWYLYVGVDFYNQNDFERAGVLFEDYMSIVSAPMFTEKDGMKVDSIYCQVLYMATVCAVNTKQEATFAKLVEELKNTPSEYQKFAYELQAAEYQKKGDMDNYIATLREGIRQFPEYQIFAANLVNYYLGENKYQEGIDYLDQMIAQNPDNVEYHRVKASVLVQVGKYDEAREILNECVKREPDNGENYYYIGRAWAEQGEKRRQYADDNWNKLSNKEFNAINEEADKCYHNALQAYENAHDKMNSQTAVYKDLVQNLYIIYFRINDKQNAEKYKAELDSFK